MLRDAASVRASLPQAPRVEPTRGACPVRPFTYSLKRPIARCGEAPRSQGGTTCRENTLAHRQVTLRTISAQRLHAGVYDTNGASANAGVCSAMPATLSAWLRSCSSPSPSRVPLGRAEMTCFGRKTIGLAGRIGRLRPSAGPKTSRTTPVWRIGNARSEDLSSISADPNGPVCPAWNYTIRPRSGVARGPTAALPSREVIS